MKILVKYLVLVRVDDVGAIFMAININTTSCTKHMDIRYEYVCEYFEDRVTKIICAKSIDNDSDILTKIQVQSFMRSIQRKWELRIFKMILPSKIFDIKRKGVRDDVLTSNILFKNILGTRLSQT